MNLKSEIRYPFFPAPGLCSLFARAKMLYRRLADDMAEIFVILHTSFFSLFNHHARQIALVFMVTTVNSCKVIFLTTGLINVHNCAALIKNLNMIGR